MTDIRLKRSSDAPRGLTVGLQVRALGHLPADWRKRDSGIAPSHAGRHALLDHHVAGDDRGHAQRAPDPDALGSARAAAPRLAPIVNAISRAALTVNHHLAWGAA
jgi:hypothetical protein